MYKYLFILVFLVFCSCQKQNQSKNEEKETSDVFITNNEDISQKHIVNPSSALIINNKNFSLENIIGTWWMGAPSYTFEIEFTNDNIFYMREFDYNKIFVDEKFYPYKIEENNIIIEDIDKSNNFNKDINDFFFTPGINGVYIDELDEKKFRFVKSENTGSNNKEVTNWASFYRGDVEGLLKK
jgi:hypothetical protein